MKKQPVILQTVLLFYTRQQIPENAPRFFPVPSYLRVLIGRKIHSCIAGSSPDSRSSSPQAFPTDRGQWHFLRGLPVTVAGPYRIHTGFSINPFGTCNIRNLLRDFDIKIIRQIPLFVYILTLFEVFCFVIG